MLVRESSTSSTGSDFVAVLRLVMKKILGHLEFRVKGIVEEQDIKKMLHWFNSNFKDGVSADEFRLLNQHVLADKHRRFSHIHIANCIFCPSRKLPFFPLFVSPFMHRRDNQCI